MNTLWQDIRYGFRQLLKNPRFTGVVALSLALGIGANTALFSVADRTLLRPIPISDADRLLAIREGHKQRPGPSGVSGPVFQELHAHTDLFAGVAAYQTAQLALIREGAPTLRWGYEVTPNFFSWLGATPLLGRTFIDEDGGPAGRGTVVLSYGFWRREFGGDPAIVGKTVPLSNETFAPGPADQIRGFTVVGVMPRQFQFPTWGAGKCDFWRPRNLAAESFAGPYDRLMRNWTVLVRLREGVGRARTDAMLAVLSERNATEHAQTSKDWTIESRPMSALFSTIDFRLTVGSLAVAVAVVLLLVCANIANLLVARAENRHREFAIRAAVGAQRGRLIRQLITESVCVAMLGATVGSLMAAWGLRILCVYLPTGLPRLREMSLDGRALGFGFLLAVVSSVLFGLAPAWRLARTTPAGILRDSGYAYTTGRERWFFQRGLIAGQIALSLFLLVGAGLMVRSVSRFLEVEPGYDPKGLLMFMVTHVNEQPAATSARLNRLREAFDALPGVTDVAISTHGGVDKLTVPGRDGDLRTGHLLVSVRDADYFRTWRIALRQGRSFTAEDAAPGLESVLINEALAGAIGPGESVLGRVFQPANRSRSYRVVGVVGNTIENPEEGAQPCFYEPYERVNHPTMYSHVTLRTVAEPASLISAVRETLWDLDRGTIPPEMILPEGQFQALVQPRRTFLAVLGFFAMTGLALAAIGLYGVLAHLVAHRTREIGVRMALGATRTNVLAMALRQALGVVGAGISAGLMISLLATRFIQSKLFGVSATDPLTFLGMATLLAAVALLACYVPARRAAKIDPMVALRCE